VDGACTGRPARGARIALTVVVLVLLAVVLAVVVAPWAPEREEAATELFSSAAGGPDPVAGLVCIPRRGTGSGAHLAGSPVSITLVRAAAPTG
jgi:hypothetical protein